MVLLTWICIDTYPVNIVALPRSSGEGVTNATLNGNWTEYGPKRDDPIALTNTTDLSLQYSVLADGSFAGNLFYIGTDYVLHQMQGTQQFWTAQEQQPPSIWPASDVIGAPIAAAGNLVTGDMWLYYMSGGNCEFAFGYA